MSDERELFERSAQHMEMRPEFRARLVELFEQSVDVLDHTVDDGSTLLRTIDTAPDETSRQRRGWSRGWLMVAAAVLVVVGLAALDRPNPATETAGHVGTEGVTAGDCENAAQLGLVTTGAAELRVGLLDDGQTFCLGAETAVGLGIVANAPAEPKLLEAAPGPAGTPTFYYLFAIPDSVPLAEVRTDDGIRATFFTSRVGRRVIIIDSEVDTPPSTTVAHVWRVFSAGGGFVGTLAADGPPSSLRAADPSVSAP